MLWVTGNLQAYTVLDLEHHTPTMRREVKVIPPGVRRYLGTVTNGNVKTTILSAHLDSDYITNIDVTLV